MKIDFKQPKYVLPLLILPFTFLLFYGYKSIAEGNEKTSNLVDSKQMQSEIGNVSEAVNQSTLDNKFKATQKIYKNANDGYTAIKGLQQLEESKLPETTNLYEDKKTLDSLQQVFDQMQKPAKRSQATSANYAQDDFEKAVKTIQQNANHQGVSNTGARNNYEDPMELFKAQMSMIDSMTKASDPEYQRQQQLLAQQQVIDQQKQDPVHVTKAGNMMPTFNTIRRDNEETFIKAIIDQDIKKGKLGNRIRIRLLDDIFIGTALLKKNSYLFATIQGYESQRVALTISSVMIANQIYPIDLTVYDNDGIEGIYVPDSEFREFSKNLGGQGTQTLGQGAQGTDNSNILGQLLTSMTQNTSQAVSKTIRKNKVNVKYGTFLYLVDQKQLNENSKSIK